MYNLACNLTLYATCSGMESKIRCQKEAIVELEAKLQANMEELKKVSMAVVQLVATCV